MKSAAPEAVAPVPSKTGPAAQAAGSGLAGAGTREDIAWITGKNVEFFTSPLWFLLADWPFTLALDTVLLPYTVPNTSIRTP